MNSIDTSMELSNNMVRTLFFDSIGIAKAKYETKVSIIKEADDLSTYDKLETLNRASTLYYLDIFAGLCMTGAVFILIKNINLKS